MLAVPVDLYEVGSSLQVEIIDGAATVGSMHMCNTYIYVYGCVRGVCFATLVT